MLQVKKFLTPTKIFLASQISKGKIKHCGWEVVFSRAGGGRGTKTLLQTHHKNKERFPSPRETFQHLATKILRYTLITKHIQPCEGIQIEQYVSNAIKIQFLFA